MTTAAYGTSGRERAGSAIEVLARAGYAAKGIVYVAVGVLSAAAAFSGGGNAQGSRDALTELASQPFGTAVLWIVAIGLVGYVIWRVIEAFKDPENRGSDAKGLVQRAVFLITAVIYGGLAVWVFQVLLGDGGAASAGGGGGGGGSGSGAQSWSAELLSQPFGAWILGAFAVGVIAYGFVEFGKAWKASFERNLRRDLSGDARRWIRKAARIGLVARGIVFLIIGGFLLHTAWTTNPDQARGLEGALQTLQGQPFGPWLMGAVAVGLVGYGILQLAKAWYRRIGPVF